MGTAANVFVVSSFLLQPTSSSAHGSTTTATELVAGTSFPTATPSATFLTSSRTSVAVWQAGCKSEVNREVDTVLYSASMRYMFVSIWSMVSDVLPHDHHDGIESLIFAKCR